MELKRNSICGCISMPCAIWTAVAMPQLPSRVKANWYVPRLDTYSPPPKLTTLRIFTQKEVELARARIGPTDSKPLTGLFKWKDIKRWHTTWHVYLCNIFPKPLFLMLTKIESPFILYIRSSVRPIRRIQYVSRFIPLLILDSNQHSDLLGQILQRQGQETAILRR